MDPPAIDALDEDHRRGEASARELPEDWHDLDVAFEANRDPLAGHDPSRDDAPLFKTILNTAPAPVGLGG